MLPQITCVRGLLLSSVTMARVYRAGLPLHAISHFYNQDEHKKGDRGWSKEDIINTLEQISANFFCKGPENKYFRLYGPYGLCSICSTLPLYCKHSYQQYVSKRAQLCSSETLFTKKGTGHTDQFAKPCSRPAAPRRSVYVICAGDRKGVL